VLVQEQVMLGRMSHTCSGLGLQSQPVEFNPFLEGGDPSVSARANPDVRVNLTLVGILG